MIAKQIPYAVLITVLTLISTASYSQKEPLQKVSGTVLTTDGRPAEHVTVLLKDTYYGGSTNAKGEFWFNAPAGRYTMVVRSIATHLKEFQVEIKASGDNVFANLEIVEQSKQLETIVVTGQFSPQSLRNSVYKVRVIGGKEIEHKAATSVESLLNTEIGLRLTNDMTLGETNIELMGMGGNNVKVLIDGIPVIDRSDKKQSLSQIDVNTIERVEIVEGPMSVIYGTDALAGVINIITKKAGASSDKNIWTVNGSAQEESVGREYSAFNGQGVHYENLGLGWVGRSGIYANGHFARNSHGGFKGSAEGRETQWQPKEQYTWNGRVGYEKTGFGLNYALDYLDEDIHTPMNGSGNIVADRYNRTYRYNHRLMSDWKVGNRLSLNMVASYQHYQRRTKSTNTDITTGETTLSTEPTAQDQTKKQATFAKVTATWMAHPKLTIQPGIEYQRTKAWGERIDGKPSSTDVAAYVSGEWRATDWFNVRPGVRAILNSDYNAPFAIPTLLTKFTLGSNIDLRLSYAYGFRAPTLEELHFSFVNANHIIHANALLKAEYSNNVTSSLTWRMLHGGNIRLSSTLSGFYNEFHDRILLVENGVVNGIMNFVYSNADRYKTVGTTLENSLTWGRFNANVNVSYIGRYNKFSADDSYNDMNMGAFRFSPEVSISASYGLPKTGTDFSLYYKFTGERYEYSLAPRSGELSLKGIDSYNWMDFTLTQKIWSGISMNAGVKNIFDITSIDNTAGEGHGAIVTKALMGYGRSYFIGLSFSLSNR